MKKKPSQILRERIGEINLSNKESKETKLSFNEFLRLAKAVKETFKKDEPNNRPEIFFEPSRM